MGRSNKNYTKFSEKKQNTVTVDKTSIKEPLVETENGQLAVEEVLVANVIKGRVVNCEKLNVRKEAKSDAEVICIIDKGSEVIIEDLVLHNGFYKVVTASGAEGYCMGQYIKVE